MKIIGIVLAVAGLVIERMYSNYTYISILGFALLALGASLVLKETTKKR